jgi:hypothetical protein
VPLLFGEAIVVELRQTAHVRVNHEGNHALIRQVEGKKETHGEKMKKRKEKSVFVEATESERMSECVSVV